MTEPGAPEVPGYEVLGILGQGGFGVVYRALQLAVRREVALKVDNRVLVSERDRRRFMREVTSAGALSGHPHVADVYDAGVLGDGRPYIVLELCPNGSLSDRLRREGPLPPAEVRDIGVRIADALAAAHAAGVLHRDVKPANILVNGYGMVALSDFGLAATAHGEGEASVTRESLTPAFGPPEAFELAEPSPAGDVYSLAATLYALLSGRPPRFPESGVVNIAMIVALHRRPIPEIPGVPPELTAVLRAGMASDLRERTPSAAALRDALAEIPAAVLSEVPAGPGPSPASGMPWPSSGGPANRPRPAGHPPGSPRPAAVREADRPEGVRPGAGRRPDRREEVRRAVVTGPGARASVSTQPRPPARPQSHSGVYVAIAGAFALLLTIGAAIMLLEQRPPVDGPAGGGTTSGPPAAGASPAAAEKVTGGVETTTAGCPAAAVAGAQAACVRQAECWGGITDVSGSVTAVRRGCEEEHSWETYAVAPLPVDALTYNSRDLARHPLVKKLCSDQVLIQSRYGRAKEIAPAKWMNDVLPPTPEAFKEGVRVFRCVGAVLGDDRPGTFFRPLS
ncbi:serine/threonine-protein kinase [Sphaerisporangium fuscum]|uniref:serine/threonine-protein kinase n=1 Tax=Sphaerisporangium fuscum TaxID=2835868 RepID=UPI001BDD1247|nr:serine/threonine-protein kinase [Sphaerisporangium fuscum]